MLLYLVRHGETQHNLHGIIQGQMDTTLTPFGIKQAKRVAERLKNVVFDALYSSDLKRAAHTAEEISKRAKLPIVENPLLRERNFGVLQGYTIAEADELFPEVANEWRKNDPATRIPQGESTLDVIERCSNFLELLKQNHLEDATICIVAHGGSLRALFGALTGISPELCRAFWFSNAGITILNMGKRNSVQLLNETAHVEELYSKGSDTSGE